MAIAIGTDRFRVGPPSPSGMRLVTDRIRSESFWIYPCLTYLHQLMGHEPGMWYWRPLGDETSRPRSNPYPSEEAVFQALSDTQEFKDLPSDQASRTPRPH